MAIINDQKEADKLPVRGLWFLSYVAPWLFVAIGVLEAGNEPLAVALALAFCIPTALAMWYGISRRRVWGYYLVWALCIVGVVLPLLTLDFKESASAAIGLAIWGTYLSKRRHLFHAKLRAVAQEAN